MSEWKECQLGDIIELITDYHSNGSYQVLKENVELLDQKDFAIMIRTTNFEQNDFCSNLKYINENAYYFLEKSKVYPDDIIMNKIANAGSIYLMPKLNQPVSLAMNLFLIRINKEKANQKFIYYYLKNNEKYIKTFAEGSVTKTITKNAVKNLVIKLPTIKIQNEIVNILECIQAKIENLRKQNNTLEQIAQTLFKHWFIDFEFPNTDGKPYKSSGGEMQSSLLGDIPVGWRVGKLGSMVNHLKENINPSKFPDKTFLHYSLPAFDAEKEPIQELGKDIKSNKYKVDSNVILVSKLNPHTPRIWEVLSLKNDFCICSTEFQVLKVKKNIYFEYCLQILNLRENIIALATMASGTSGSHRRIKPSDILDINCIIPSEEHFLKIHKVLNPLIRKQNKNKNQIQTLKNIRDTLLPKLMSGELRVQ